MCKIVWQFSYQEAFGAIWSGNVNVYAFFAYIEIEFLLILFYPVFKGFARFFKRIIIIDNTKMRAQIKREIEEQRLEREDAERLAKEFSGAFSFGIYSPLPIKEDEKLDKEMYRDVFNMLSKAVSKLSWSSNSLERLKSLDKLKIILTVEYNLG